MPTDFLSVLALLDRAEVQASRAVETLLAAGFKAVAPVDPLTFADADVRSRWKSDSGMLVLSFWDPGHRRPTVDIFCEYPMDFESLFRDSGLLTLSGTKVRVASIDHLIAIKRAAGRPKDLEDASRLAQLVSRGES
ncbi:MAG: hypothetical protein U1F35_20570 [Steroidobacteraceae bacterium]